MNQKLEQIRPKEQIDIATEEGRGEVHIALITRDVDCSSNELTQEQGFFTGKPNRFC